ncbi:MAG: hypothetical protein ACREBC_30865, partial [Pyrinomonadaceae bacterium]
AKLDQGFESMRKLVYAFYNEGFSFSQFLRKYPDERVNIINLLIGDVFRDGVDKVYGPMSDFAEIPPPLYELAPNGRLEGVSNEELEALLTKSDAEEILSAQYQYYDDR